MSIAITQTIHVLQVIVQSVPMGTNLALLQLIWRINECIDQWHTYVLAKGQWHSHSYEGYRPVGL
jgi:hypothetical protein